MPTVVPAGAFKHRIGGGIVDRRRRSDVANRDAEDLRTGAGAVGGLGDSVGVARRGFVVDLGESATVTTPVAALMAKPPNDLSPSANR